MSIHLRENLPIQAKKGRPGEWSLVELSEEPLTYEQLAAIADEILDYCDEHDDGFLEMDKVDARVVQLKDYRIVITHPPFADAMEITIVKPTIQKILESYSISPKLFDRLRSSAEGILIAGSPGAGKSTFAAAVAGFYANNEKIVKTIENPRDLSVDDRITQYTMIEDDPELTGDVLLLMRPDYVVYDEVRKSKDFEVFSDLRLSGIGLIGVVHATKPVDAIQRFVGRVDLGMIPSIIDTVIFIDKGEIDAVLSLKMSVKVPEGMKSGDLARPVVEINDFQTNKTVYEMFSFGEQIVMIPVGSLAKKRQPVKQLDVDEITKEIIYLIDDTNVRVEQIGRNTVRIYIPTNSIKGFIGRKGANIQQVEKMLGVSIDVEAIEGVVSNVSIPDSFGVRIREERKHLIISVGKRYAGKNVDLLIGPQILMTATVDFSGEITLSRKKASTKRIEKLLNSSDSPLTAKLRT